MSGGAHVDPSNKKIALLISILALILAISETLGNGAQTKALAANLWNFFQAKTVRMTVLRATAEAMETESAGKPSPQVAAQIEKWRKTAERYDNEPDTNEGRKQLMARAKSLESSRDLAMSAYHQYEIASAAVQIAIVLASSAVITGLSVLSFAAFGLGVVGVAFTLIGLFAPTAVHLF
jgi:predicted Co/Zn/Cd cation transporter (cation efflux family)